MLVVNSEKILRDYQELLAKHEKGLAEVEASARSFALERGYDEQKANAFIEYVKNAEGDRLSEEESSKFLWLSQYIQLVEDEPSIAINELINEREE